MNEIMTKAYGWIPTAERLPERFEKVILCRGDGTVEAGCRDVLDWWKVYGTRIKKVTHWMPMPQPPEDGAITIADRIRSMNDDLCRVLYDVGDGPYCKEYEKCVKRLDEDNPPTDEDCMGCIKRWLAKPAGKEGLCDGK